MSDWFAGLDTAASLLRPANEDLSAGPRFFDHVSSGRLAAKHNQVPKCASMGAQQSAAIYRPEEFMKRSAGVLVLVFSVFSIGAVFAIAQQYPPPPRPGPPPNDPWVYGPGPQTWNPGWNSRPNPRRGACFYTSYGFQGNHFCVRGGRQPSSPARKLWGQHLFDPGFWRSKGSDLQRPELFKREHLDQQKRGRSA